MFTHDHALKTYPTIQWDSGARHTIYVIQTDLELAPDDPAYDKTAVDDLTAAAVEYLKARENTYDSLRIEPFSAR